MDDLLKYVILPQLTYLEICQFCLINKHYHTFYSYKNYELLVNAIRLRKYTSPHVNGKNIHTILHEIYSKIMILIKNNLINTFLWIDKDKFILLETHNILNEYIDKIRLYLFNFDFNEIKINNSHLIYLHNYGKRFKLQNLNSPLYSNEIINFFLKIYKNYPDNFKKILSRGLLIY